jgi:nitrate/TMAO reductase-like tetraheme cytochrome c subunit
VTPTPRTPSWFLLTRHWLSLTGIALVATAVISVLFVESHEIRGHGNNPYVGILVFLIIPLIFFAGLALIPLGVYLSKREIRAGLAAPSFDRKAALRRIALFLGIATGFNVLLGTQLTYRAVEYMETPNFCGSTCHTMKPQMSAYANSPHSRVVCVDCHVSPGASGWISSKVNGTRQLFLTLFNTFPRPIPPALESNRLVPNRGTCENCHWPQKFGGVRFRLFSKFAEDESNTRTDTVMLMVVGGEGIPGIHNAHMAPGVHIRFAAANPARQSIPWIEYRNDSTNQTRTFISSGSDPPGNPPGELPKYEMQCVDCHNRPTHTFELPERAIDKALTFGEIPSGLPFIKKESVRLLKTDYGTGKDAAEKLPAGLIGFYRQNYPEIYASRSGDIDRAGKTILAIYNRNVFPDMKVGWGTYPNNLGHTDFPGCFRCHDGSHTAQDGTAITQDCTVCHQPLAMDEASPEILKTLGLAERIAQMQKK